MKRCPYAISVLDFGNRETVQHFARCQRRSVLGSPGWHLHRAEFPKSVDTISIGRDIPLRWRSLSTPDHYKPDL